ncbi:hypothetical protein DV737_g2122, partial [Chaetothyriales sp. CBS 132003]
MSLEGMPEAEQPAPDALGTVAHEASSDSHRTAAAQKKSLVFQQLLGALSTLHQRIKTKYPSRFLATSLPAALGAYRKLPITVETTTAFLQCLDQLSSPHRPPLPPRASSAEVAGASRRFSAVPLPDPEGASEAHTGGNVASENEKAIIKRLLQAVLVEIIDEYLSSLQHDDEDPSMRWTCRLREKLEPGRRVPGRESVRERWQRKSGLRARDGLIDEFTKLSSRLGLDAAKELRVATGQDEAPAEASNGGGEEEFEYPVSPSQVPFAITGLVQLAAASAFASGKVLEAQDISVSLLFKSTQRLSERAIIPLPALQDALCSILYQQPNWRPDSRLLSSTADIDFKTLIAMLTQSFTVVQDAQTRDDTHHITTKLLHQRQCADDRIEIIKQTIRCTVEPLGGPAIALCPPYLEGTLKAVGVDWLKDEILWHVSQTRPDADADGPAAGLDPSVLEKDSELGHLIAPDVPALGDRSTVDADTTTRILLSLPYYISILNLACILFTRTSMNKDSDTFKGADRVLGSIEEWTHYLVEQMSVDEAVTDSASDIFALEDACGRAGAVLVKRAQHLAISPSAAVRPVPVSESNCINHTTGVSRPDRDVQYFAASGGSLVPAGTATGSSTGVYTAGGALGGTLTLPRPSTPAVVVEATGAAQQWVSDDACIRCQASGCVKIGEQEAGIGVAGVEEEGAADRAERAGAGQLGSHAAKLMTAVDGGSMDVVVGGRWTDVVGGRWIDVVGGRWIDVVGGRWIDVVGGHVNIAVFYATYRPISITGPGPREVQMDEIEKLFQAKPKSRLRTAQNEVIYTLSSMIENLSEQVEQRQASHENQGVGQKADLVRQIMQNNENSKPISIESHGSKHVVKLDVQKLTHHFRPFNVPPPPDAVSQAELDLLDAEEAAAAAASEANDELLAQELELQSEQDLAAEAAATLGRRHGEKLKARLAAQEHRNQPAQSRPAVAEGVFNVRASEEDMQNGSFFTSHLHMDDPELDGQLVRGVQMQSGQQAHRVGGGGRRRRGVLLPSTQQYSESMKLINAQLELDAFVRADVKT